jgi:exonuclease 1
MGISGLLPLLKSIQVSTHIKHYAGKVVGVDAYVWLHKGAFACAWDLALGNPTKKYLLHILGQLLTLDMLTMRCIG